LGIVTEKKGSFQTRYRAKGGKKVLEIGERSGFLRHIFEMTRGERGETRYFPQLIIKNIFEGRGGLRGSRKKKKNIN